jgi:DMSO/TMAO reductase YedYZ molybdopterin-dependent catalytic subunit
MFFIDLRRTNALKTRAEGRSPAETTTKMGGHQMITRRRLLEGAGTGAALAGLGIPLAKAAIPGLSDALPSGARSEAILEALPGKKPLIKLSYRAPNYETPIAYFRQPITPNDAFFVRYHLDGIPQANDKSIDPKTWRVEIGGEGANGQASLSLDDLKAMPAAEVVAVNQCSGNRRGLFEPHVPGVEWGYGAMGCARWKGARLKDVLDKVGLKKEAIEIVLNGADGPVVDKTPDFIKSIPVWKAIEDTTLIAYEMNGAPLPHLNGAPARVIVPGWTGTYWMKHVVSIKAATKPESGFWMNPAYRIPVGKFPVVARFISQENATSTPITEMVVNSLITSPAEGASVKAGTVTIGGIAWDGGYGIRTVELSTDGGKTWKEAALGQDLGRYAFRPFSLAVQAARGRLSVTARATNAIGQTQTAALIPNPAGYHHNVMHRVTLNVG